jgi:hypothetical protein
MNLHEIRWQVDGKPILGTYTGGTDKLKDLRLIHEAGMNTVLGDEPELDPKTPEGAFCREKGIKVLYHLTKHLYHGIKLRDAITPDQTTIPLTLARKQTGQEDRVVQIDDEMIRYETMTEAGLVNCQRGYSGTKPAEHREGTILLWPQACAEEIERIKGSPNLLGYYVLDDSPGDAVSALRAMYKTIQRVDPGSLHPVCAGFGNAGSLANLAPGVCDIMFIYWYPVSSRSYDRERTSQEVQRMLTTARKRAPGIPFVGIYQAFDGSVAKTGQGVPTGEQLREQLEDFVREGACGLVAFISRGGSNLPGWADLDELGSVVRKANREILDTGGLMVRPETESMKSSRIQPEGHWETPRDLPGVVPAWHVVGPFEDTEGKILEAVFPPDQGLDLNTVYQVKTGSAKWRVRETTCGVLGLAEIHGGLRNGIAYLSCDVTSPSAQTVQMRLCADDDACVRLNGKEVHRSEGPNGLDYDKDIVSLELPKGQSRIEAKVYNRGGMWGFFARFTDLEGRPLEGLQFSPQGN